MTLMFENELSAWLDIDITGIWDHILDPEATDSGRIPLSNDYQVLVGFGIDF